MSAPRRKRLRYTVLDVFTDAPLAGNALAVVHDADAIDDDTMQRFARETRLSETTFVQSATAEGADYRNRIFTIRAEVPFAGHPSVGTAVAVARARGQTEAEYVQQTGAGLQSVAVRDLGELAHASVLQEPAWMGPEVDAGDALAAVRLEESAADPGLTPQVVSTGLPTLIVPVREEPALQRAAPDLPAVERVHDGAGALSFYLAYCEPDEGRARARMFSAYVSDGEDPATGSAAGTLCAYLAERCGSSRVELTQGVEMGRPSRLVCELEGDRVRVGGGVVAVVDGEVAIGPA